MSELEAIILGLLQGFTEFLPVSSSGHLAIGKTFFGLNSEDLSFEIAVHAATVLSTIIALRKEIWKLLGGALKLELNEETQYILKILVSMIPILVVGLFFKDIVESFFGSGLLIVGIMLIITSALLSISEILSNIQRKRKGIEKEIGYKEAFIIGLAQSFAVLPGLSRSGSTIATGLLCGVKKDSIAQFSFLMVLIPILGQALLSLLGGEFGTQESGISTMSLVLGFSAAFISGFIACNWMIKIVKKAKLFYFAIYCLTAGIIAILTTVF